MLPLLMLALLFTFQTNMRFAVHAILASAVNHHRARLTQYEWMLTDHTQMQLSIQPAQHNLLVVKKESAK